MEKTRLFVDMDGTLAEFKVVDTIETLYEKGYFEQLKPHENVVDAVKEIMGNEDIEVYIMSSVLSDSEYALQEKNKWLDKYLPEINSEHRIFPPCGKDKIEYVPEGIRRNDFLLDDYTKNLVLWQPPAKGIKLLNGINHTNGTWQSSRLDFNKNAVTLSNNIIDIIKNGKTIMDPVPKKHESPAVLTDEDRLDIYYEVRHRFDIEDAMTYCRSYNDTSEYSEEFYEALATMARDLISSKGYDADDAFNEAYETIKRENNIPKELSEQADRQETRINHSKNTRARK